MKPKFRSLIAAFAPLSRSSLIVCASLCAVASANADQTWTGAVDTSWTVAGNWNTTIPGAADVVIFDALSSSLTNNATFLNATTSVKGLKVVDPATVVSIGAGNTLTLGTSGIDLTTATQNLTIAAPLDLGVVQDWDIATGRVLAVNGGINGVGGFTKKGAGNMTFGNVANGYSGNTTLNAGTVTLGSGTSFSPASLGVAGSTVTLAGGTITNGTGGSNGAIGLNYNFVVNADSIINMGNRCGIGGGATARTVTGTAKLTINAGTTISRDELTANFNSYAGTLSFGGSGNLRPTFVNGGFGGMTAAAVELNGTASLTPVGNSTGNTIGMGSLTGVAPAGIGGPSSGGTQTYSIGSLGTSTTYDGGIVGNNNIAKVGAGTLTLTNTTALTYTGTTTVTAGFLKINGVKSGVGATAVNSGGTLTGSGSIAGTTNVNTGGVLTSGDTGVGTLTFSSLTLGGGSILRSNLSGNTPVVSGTLTLTSGATVDVNGFATDGTYTLINYAGGAIAGAPASTALSAVNGGSKAYTFADTGSAITMTISSSDPTNFWNVDGGGTWNAAGNWTKSAIPNAIGAIAKVGPGIGGAGGFFTPLEFAISLDANHTIGTFVAQIDNISTLTIDPGTPAGTLSFDNGVSSSILSGVLGDLIVNAPIAVDAQGLAVDVAMRTNVEPNTPFLITLNGVVSGASAALSKSGLGTLVLAGDNSYGGGTVIGAGTVRINSATSLGNPAAAATFAGGTLQLANAITGVTRSYQVSGANSAIINTGGFEFGYDGVISPLGGGTGGLNKIGGGTMTLTAAQTYTGATNVSGGTLAVAGGSLTNSAAAVVTGAGLTLSSGSIAFNGGLNGNNNNPSSNVFLNLTGGTFSTSFLTMGRSATTINTPTQGNTTSGLYINGATATVTGALSVGLNSTGTNSTASARIDSGSLTVDGAVLISVASPDRWSVMDVNGGTFTSTNVATGVQIGSGQTGSDAFLVRNGVATVERFLLQQPAASTETSLLNVSGGTLYIGAGGIVGNNNAGVGILDVQLGSATLGAKAAWSTLLGATLNTTTIIKAADAVAAPFDIGIAGVLGGVGGLEKTGGGTLTLSGVNTYAGTTLVSAGNLAITGDSSGALGAVTVANGATLSGSGNIGGSVTVQSGGHQAFAVAATSGAQVTRTITGILDLQGGNILDLTSAGPIADGVYVLATATGGITGSLGSFTLSGGLTGTPSVSGSNLILTVSSSAYASWASGYGLQDPWLGLNPALNGTPGADPDNDGIANELEFALGGNPTLSSTNVLPALSVTATNFVYTFNRVDASEAEVALAFQSGTTLAAGSWTSLAIGVDTAASGSGVVVTENGGAADTIVVTIAKGANTKLFGRLQAVK